MLIVWPTCCTIHERINVEIWCFEVLLVFSRTSITGKPAFRYSIECFRVFVSQQKSLIEHHWSGQHKRSTDWHQFRVFALRSLFSSPAVVIMDTNRVVGNVELALLVKQLFVLHIWYVQSILISYPKGSHTHYTLVRFLTLFQFKKDLDLMNSRQS